MTQFREVQIGPCRLINADCMDVLPTLNEGSVDAVITDPPYSSGGQFRGDRMANTITKYVHSGPAQDRRQEFTGDNRDQRSFLAWCSLWMNACGHAANAGAVMCCFSDWRQVPVITDAVQCGGWTWRNLCTWWKPGCRMQKGRFSSSAEFVVYATNGPHMSDGESSLQNVISCATLAGDQKEHIAEKPREVLHWLVGASRESSIVLDPFMGSGSTGLACLDMNRKFIGIEKDREIYARTVKRIQQAWELKCSELPFEKPPVERQLDLLDATN